MSHQTKTLIDNSASTPDNYDMNSLGNSLDNSERDQLKATAESNSKSGHFLPPSPNNSFDRFRPNTQIPEEPEDEEDLLTNPKYLLVKEKLKLERVSESDIEYLETKLHILPDINFDSAMMTILQYKIDCAHNNLIPNKGIHKTEAPPYAFYDDDQMELPKTKKFKLNLKEMNKKLYTENRIEWIDYIKLKEDDSVDYRNDQGKFVVAKVMEKDGVELVLYTKEGQTVMINFLNQYPFQRLFKIGAVTARVPKKIRRKSVEIGSQIRLLCDTDFIMDSKWSAMECCVVDRDIDHVENENDSENDDIPKQIQIEFKLNKNNQTNNLTHTNGDINNKKTHRMWVHLDNTKPDPINENCSTMDDDDDDDNDDDVDPIIINKRNPQCCIVM